MRQLAARFHTTMPSYKYTYYNNQLHERTSHSYSLGGATANTRRMRRAIAISSARQAIAIALTERAIAIPSVCPSVHLSHRGISQKRLNLGSCNFHRTE